LLLLVLFCLWKKRTRAAAETIRQRAATDELMGGDTVEMQMNPHVQARARSDTTHNFGATIDQMVAVGRIDTLQARDRTVPLEIARANIQLVTTIGKGQFGEVWKGLIDLSETTGTPAYMVAVKTVLDAQATPEGLAELVQEAVVMAQVGMHPNLVALIGVHTSTAEKMIVLSYCEHGSLLSVLRTDRSQGSPLSPSTKLRMMLEVARGMAHLTSKRFVHRDLACRNVLLSTGMVCKVADFGLSRVAVKSTRSDNTTGAGEDEDYYRTAAGTFPIRWTAPECMESMKFNQSSDVWSFGVTMWECYSDGDRPYGEMSNMLVLIRVEQGYTLEKPRACTPAAYMLLAACLESDVAQRPAFAEVVERLEALAQADEGANGANGAGVGGGGAPNASRTALELGGAAGYATTANSGAAGYTTAGGPAAGYAGA
jgi:serine/threonine protein kinase